MVIMECSWNSLTIITNWWHFHVIHGITQQLMLSHQFSFIHPAWIYCFVFQRGQKWNLVEKHWPWRDQHLTLYYIDNSWGNRSSRLCQKLASFDMFLTNTYIFLLINCINRLINSVISYYTHIPVINNCIRLLANCTLLWNNCINRFYHCISPVLIAFAG